MEYSRIDFESDFSWNVVVCSSEDAPVNPVLFNRLCPELRKLIVINLSWADEMFVFEMPWGYIHPWSELTRRYGVKCTDAGWSTKSVGSHSGVPNP